MRPFVLAFLFAPLAALAQPTPEAAAAFERGLGFYSEGATDQAKTAFEEAYRLDTLFVDPAINLGVLTAREGDYPAAIDWYRRALAASDATASTATDSSAVAWADARVNTLAGLLAVGSQFFSEERFAEAQEVFEVILSADPEHRDALYNQTLVLYSMENWEVLAPMAARLVEMDPLNENAYIILFNAHKGIADAGGGDEHRMQALAALENVEALPVYLDGLYFEQADGVVTVRGTVRGNAAEAGETIPVTFDLVGPFGVVASGTATLSAPTPGMTEPFELPIPSNDVIGSWRYRVGR